MRTCSSGFRLSAGLFVVFLLAFPTRERGLQAQEPVKVNVGAPTLWTLEQAHYLLARQRAGNLTLEGRRLTPDDLDANATHSSRLNALRTLFGLEVAFDQTIGEENRRALQQSRDIRETRASLAARVDDYRAEQLTLLRKIGELKIEAAGLSPETQKAARAMKDAEVAAKEAEVKHLDDRITETKSLLDKTQDEAVDLKTANLSQTWALGSGALSSELAKKAVEGMNAPPRLHASMMLDNYIQMQYELIAKQLSLLRDDVGAENRLVFLELPASVYTTPTSGKDKLVQSAWRIHSYIECPKDTSQKRDVPTNVVQPLEYVCGQGPSGSQKTDQADFKMRPFSRTDIIQLQAYVATESNKLEKSTDPPIKEHLVTATDDVRVVDLFPRQAALNVNQAHEEVSKVSLSGIWQAIGGFGAKTQFERQRELFEHYIQQEVFAAGYGKGLAQFAWTFGPLPGSRQVAPGIKTTYAAVVLPATARALVLKGRACWFKRKDSPPDAFGSHQRAVKLCEEERSFVLKVPGSSGGQHDELEGFNLQEIEYRTAQAGEIATVVLKGTFSPQVGVLVEGIPLARRIGLGQLELNGTSQSFDGDRKAIQGEFEYVNQRVVALRLAAPRTFEGIPRITLVTPQRVADINHLTVQRINTQTTCLDMTPLTLDCTSTPVFQVPLALTGLQVLSVNKQSGVVLGHLVGSGFRPGLTVSLNGAAVQAQVASPTLLRVDFVAPQDATWIVTAIRSTVTGNETVQLALDNPLLVELDKIAVVSVASATSSQKERVVVQITGSGFVKALDVFTAASAVIVPNGVSVSPSAVLVEVEGPADPFRLEWSRTIGSSVSQRKFWTIAREKDQPGKWVVK